MQHFIWVFTVKVTLNRYPEGLGPVAQAEVSPTADPGVVSSIPALSHTFVEIDREIISMVILLLLVVVSQKRKLLYLTA